MTRNHRTAREAGTKFERGIADDLAATVDDRIDRKVKTGAKDKGDIANVRTRDGKRITVECKDTAKPALGPWSLEVEAERINDANALAGVVIHKRHGHATAGNQWVTMTVRDFAAILRGDRTHAPDVTT